MPVTNVSTERTPSTPPPARGRRPLFVVLGLLGLSFVISLPWQQRQWKQVEKLRSETQSQQVRLESLQTLKNKATASEQSLGQHPESLEALFQASEAAFTQNNRPRVAQLLATIEEKLQTNPTPDIGACMALSQLYQRLGWLDRGLFYAEKAVALDPKSPPALVTLAFIEAHLGWLERAWPHLKQAQSLAPDTPGIHSAQALLHDQMGAYNEVEKSLQAALKQTPNDWPTSVLLARNQMAQKRFTEALATLAAAEKSAPSQPGILSAQVEAQFNLAQQKVKGAPAELATALELAQRYLQLSPDSAQDGHYWVGKILLAQKKEKEALAEWEKIYTPQTDSQSLLIGMGQLLVRQGQRARGEALLARSRELRRLGEEYTRWISNTRDDFKNPELHRQFARWCQKEGRLPRAIIEWEQVLVHFPQDVEASSNRDRCIAQRSKR
ncbi:MAG: tetratricopeptide repeat protein [Armatimonadetes bacterium]|nr:tetratricopeptide repeat protein [Armatimonadota bacterium]